MFKNLVLVLLPFVALSDESCDRKEMLDTICSLCTQRRGQQTAFYAYMSTNVPISSLSKHKTFVYNRIETNAGNAYNSATGKFTAPGEGMYVFHTSTPAYDKSYCTIEVVKNGIVKDIGLADAYQHNDRALSSTMTILSLKKGDVIYVRAGFYGGHMLESTQYVRMSFSGFKLV